MPQQSLIRTARGGKFQRHSSERTASCTKTRAFANNMRPKERILQRSSSSPSTNTSTRAHATAGLSREARAINRGKKRKYTRGVLIHFGSWVPAPNSLSKEPIHAGDLDAAVIKIAWQRLLSAFAQVCRRAPWLLERKNWIRCSGNAKHYVPAGHSLPEIGSSRSLIKRKTAVLFYFLSAVQCVGWIQSWLNGGNSQDTFKMYILLFINFIHKATHNSTTFVHKIWNFWL
jgi:hypothetical protein